MPKTNRASRKSKKAVRTVEVPYVPIACNTCRNRKVKCGGEPPCCTTCKRDDYDCTWSEEPDGRRHVSREYADTIKSTNQTYKATIELLESQLALVSHQRDAALRQLAALSGNVEPPLPDPFTGSSSLTPGEAAQSSADGLGPDNQKDKLCTAIATMLKLEDDSDPALYGATSPFALTRTPPATGSDSTPLNTAIICHELILDSSSLSVANASIVPCVGFDRFLPKVGLTRLQHDILLDRFFKFFTCWCLRLHPIRFRRDMYVYLSTVDQPGKPKTTHYSPLLHNAIMAAALAFTDDQKFKVLHRDAFVIRAKDLIEEECRRPSLSAVQGLAVLASYYSGASEQSLGFMYFGMSIRMSQALGLGFGESSEMPHDVRQERAWMFWMTFAQDKCWSIYVGRDAGVRAPRTPLPIPEDTSLDTEEWVWNERDEISRKSHLSLTFGATVRLFLLANDIMDAVYGQSTTTTKNPMSHRAVADIHLQLDGWFDRLPEQLRIPHSTYNSTVAPPHILALHLAFYWVTILLRRPFYRVISTNFSTASSLGPRSLAQYAQSSRGRCNTAADQITRLLLVWQRLYGLRFVPITCIQVAFTAGTTYLLEATEYKPKPPAVKLNKKQVAKRDSALESVRECIEFLREMGESWEAAVKNAEILEGLLEEQTGQKPNLSASTTGSKWGSNSVVTQPVLPPPSEARASADADANFLQTLLDFDHPISEGPSTVGSVSDPPVMSFEELLHAPILWMSSGNAIPPQPFASVLVAEDYMLLDQYFGGEETTILGHM